MTYTGERYQFSTYHKGFMGLVIRLSDLAEIAFLQDTDCYRLTDELDAIEPNEHFTSKQIIDLVLDAYDYTD